MFEELIDKHPILVVPFVGTLLALVSFILSISSGWNSLASKYKVKNWKSNAKWRFQTMKANAVDYSNCVTFGADSENIYLSVIFFVRLFHPPLAIPYSNVKLSPHEKSSLVIVQFDNVDGKFILPKKLSYKLVMASNGKLKINNT